MSADRVVRRGRKVMVRVGLRRGRAELEKGRGQWVSHCREG